MHFGDLVILRPFATLSAHEEDRERWMELAEQASKEQDPKKLFELVEEINRLLQEKEDRLRPNCPRQSQA